MSVQAPVHSHRAEALHCVYPNAAGIDIGSEEVVVALPPERDEQPVRAFRTFTADLHNLVAWLLGCGIDTVAMESTGVYGIPLYDLLEQHGIIPFLVNPHHVKTVPGRKTDWNDAQWLQKLHTFGLLQASFRPDAEMRVIRTLLRHRAQLIEHRSPHVNHIQHTLKQMNLHLSTVLTDIMGTTGQAILRAIVAGERDPVALAQLRNPACRSSEELIAQALTGTWPEEHLFVLQQSLALFDFYSTQLLAGDQQIEQRMVAMNARHESAEPLAPLPASKPHAKSKNQPQFNARLQ